MNRTQRQNPRAFSFNSRLSPAVPATGYERFQQKWAPVRFLAINILSRFRGALPHLRCGRLLISSLRVFLGLWADRSSSF